MVRVYFSSLNIKHITEKAVYSSVNRSDPQLMTSSIRVCLTTVVFSSTLANSCRRWVAHSRSTWESRWPCSWRYSNSPRISCAITQGTETKIPSRKCNQKYRYFFRQNMFEQLLSGNIRTLYIPIVTSSWPSFSHVKCFGLSGESFYQLCQNKYFCFSPPFPLCMKRREREKKFMAIFSEMLKSSLMATFPLCQEC